jgi:PA14 domain/Bacterial Ig domain
MPAISSFRGAVVLTALAVIPVFAQSVTLGLSNTGLSSLKYNGTEFVNNGAFQVNEVMLRNAAGTVSDANLTLTGSSVDASRNELTLSYNWGSVKVDYVPAGSRLNMTITTTNTSASTIQGVFYEPLDLQFPSTVQEYDGNTPMVSPNLGQPTLEPMTYNSGVLVFTNEDPSKPLMAGFPWALDKPTDKVFALRVNTDRESMYPTFYPYIDRPIAPGASDQYQLALRFGPMGSTVQSLAGDIYQKFAADFPSQFNWPDRRPIGMLVLGTPATGWVTNPRGWLLDPTIDVTTAAGIAILRTRILQWADDSIAVLKSVNAQGMITWDIEGEQFPPATTYVGDPRVFMTTAPEMAGIADDYFQKFRNAGLQVGVCVRPQQFTLAPDGLSANQLDLTDPTQLLIDKINYAKNRWGATLIYVDSNGGPDNPMDATIFKNVLAAVPGILIMPEHEDLQYYAYSAPYQELRQNIFSSPPEARITYPAAFSIINVADGQIGKYYNNLVTAVSQGDILMLRGWFDDGSVSQVNAIYQAAGRSDTIPPTVTITAPKAGSTVSGSVALQVSASDNIGVAGVQYSVDGFNLGTEVTTAPFSSTLNTASYANGAHILTATARDAASNTATSAAVSITIKNADTVKPTVSITAPGSGASVSGTVTVTATASDNVGVAGVQFKIDGANLGAEDVTSPYSVSLNTASYANGAHTLTTTARDAAGNTATSAAVSITVSNSGSGGLSCSVPGNGFFVGCYYTGINFNKLKLTRTDPTINFDWSSTPPATSMPLVNYSVRWQGSFTFQAGNYQFNVSTDDGERLYIDGTLVYGNWTEHAADQVTVTKTLTTGSHTIRLDYFQSWGDAIAQLSWTKLP